MDESNTVTILTAACASWYLSVVKLVAVRVAVLFLIVQIAGVVVIVVVTASLPAGPSDSRSTRSEVQPSQQNERTYQSLVDDAEHERVVHQDVGGVLLAEADVGDGRVSGQPQGVHSSRLQLSTPPGVLLVQQRVLEDLRRGRG